LPLKKDTPMKRQKVYLMLACLLAILSIFAIAYKKGVFKKDMSLKKISTVFAIKDTTTISQIFIADMFGNQALLTKTDRGWMVENSKPAAAYKIDELLATLSAIRVAQYVPKNSKRTIIERLAVSSTKVEIYETKPLFKLFKIPFFSKQRLLKTYYLGDAIQTNLGSYALVEGMSDPYVIYKPGFRGYITPQFSTDPVDWFSPRIFSTKLTRIQKAEFVDIENPENSFFVEKSGPRTFTLFNAHENIILDYDTTLLVNMLSEFRERNYEMFFSKMTQSQKDSILKSNFFKVISITDVDNITTTMKLYHQIDTGSLLVDGDIVEEFYRRFNRDRCYVTINDNNAEIFSIQYFHFDRQIQPLSYYSKK
jgi:hypothetical protein